MKIVRTKGRVGHARGKQLPQASSKPVASEGRTLDKAVSFEKYRKLAVSLGVKRLGTDSEVEAEFPIVARALYMSFVKHLYDAVLQADLAQPEEFHGFLWLSIKLGAAQGFIAREQYVDPSMVSRWINGEQTPEARRRRGILQSALTSLSRQIAQHQVVPLRGYVGKRARASAEVVQMPKRGIPKPEFEN